jgi:hypothetical protein
MPKQGIVTVSLETISSDTQSTVIFRAKRVPEQISFLHLAIQSIFTPWINTEAP